MNKYIYMFAVPRKKRKATKQKFKKPFWTKSNNMVHIQTFT